MKKYYILLIVSVMVFGVTVSADAISITNGLVAYYALDGNANDGSVNSNDGTEHGGLSYVAGVHGQAVSLDGIDDYIAVADDNSLDLTTTGTLAAWVKLQYSGFNQFDAMISKSGDSNVVSYELIAHSANDGLSNVYIQGYANDGSVNTAGSSNTDIYDNVWHHVAFSWNGAVGNIYLDGQIANDSTTAGSGAWASTYQLTLGWHNQKYQGERYLKGLLDDVAIYNRDLSSSEVAQLAQVVPEPTTIVLLGIGLAGLAGVAVRRKLEKQNTNNAIEFKSVKNGGRFL